jgi:UDP-N-acetylglucosamine 2-epimerase (non-hydrolysing)
MNFDRTMPEEINRIVTDSISDYLFTTDESVNHNLRREGIPEDWIFFTENVMFDTYCAIVRRQRNRRFCKTYSSRMGWT